MDVEYFHLRLPESDGIHPTISKKKKDQKKDDGAHKLGTKQKCFEANLRFVQLMIAPE
jgi:hypothetical protein